MESIFHFPCKNNNSIWINSFLSRSVFVSSQEALNILGNHTGAIEYFDKALAIDPKTNKLTVKSKRESLRL
jgi:hypothetical protein